ncbi:MAG: hypothetical protein KGI70_01325 [Patescibacteria group bacterium]|nr:hypothetical protein [Patescibacteria group bacterium]
MEQDIEQKIMTRMAQLPQNVRDAIASADMSTKIREIGTRNRLHIDQIGELEDEVLMVMLGFTPLDTFPAHLSEKLNTPKEMSETLAKELNDTVFLPIRENMKKPAEGAAPTEPLNATPQEAVRSGVGAAPVAPTPKVAIVGPTTALPKAPASPLAQEMLTQKTATYATDPYREPVEP